MDGLRRRALKRVSEIAQNSCRFLQFEINYFTLSGAAMPESDPFCDVVNRMTHMCEISFIAFMSLDMTPDAEAQTHPCKASALRS
jgi:hypothetical protein